MKEWAKPRISLGRTPKALLGQRITPHFRGRRIDEITRRDIKGFLDKVERDVSAYRRNAALAFAGCSIGRSRKSSSGEPGFTNLAASVESRDRVLSYEEVSYIWRAAAAVGAAIRAYVSVLSRYGAATR
ncbi:MAG: hypothetical protein R3C54_05800 [Parvularculaceae bacterium]